jgi:hypothetical protein
MKRALQIALGLLLAVGLQSAAAAQSATVMTDQADYAPGTIVTITGSGWQPGETVTLSFVESPLVDTHPDLYATADANGNIFNNQFSPDQYDVSITFTLTATGQTSGLQAQTTFTDNKTVTIAFTGTGSGNVTSSGGSGSLNCNSTGGTASGICSSSGFGNTDTVTLTATPTSPSTVGTWSVPAYTIVTGCTTGSTTCKFTMNNTSQTITVQFNPGPASKLVFTNTAVTVTAGVCSSALTVQSQDSSGNVSNVSSTETLAPSASPSAGASFYTDNTCTTTVTASNLTIPTGSNTATFFFKDAAAGSITLTVTGTGAFTANGANAATQTETVNAAVVRRGQTIVATLLREDRPLASLQWTKNYEDKRKN